MTDGRVRRLDRATVDRIAAGEVITCPDRVVAELVDNALDAGASRVSVAVDGDGTERIRVDDDGRGMDRTDALLAVERHATSKLAPGGDPVGVGSLGFRGEALAAIADAARLELTTNDGGAVGTRVTAGPGFGGNASDPEADVGGDRNVNERRGADGHRGADERRSDGRADLDVADAGRGRGTTVVVRDLFATRPARRESLAGPKTEFARVSALVGNYALANPDVAFTLDHDGTRTLSTPGTGPTDALLGVYDRDTAGRSTTLSATVDLEVDDDGDGDGTRPIDVTGVLAYPSVTRASRDHLRSSVNGRPVRNERLAAAVRAGYGRLLPNGREPVAAVDVSVPPERVDPNVHPAKREVGLHDGGAVADAVEGAVADALTGADLRRRAAVDTDLETALEPVGEPDGSRGAVFADVTPLGSFRDLYLLFESGDELLVVDAHAAHERVNYERLRRAFDGDPVRTADLDPPATLSLSAAEAAAADAHAEALATLGFATEPFGGGTVRLRGVPAPFGRVADADAFRDALASLSAGGSSRDARETLLADLACHPSLKRGDVDELTAAERRALLDRLGECERPFACPHGRPTTLSVSEATFAAGFGRDR
ncbi:DNA mismatch repair protein MutL [Halorubrum sp. JWXQ-INN 858]|uniref:DNA mismatch repair endonuclease MutL n=1 Tax=Halorubrum sp. JWXQ-INN 858 TaxID=2690782 RepID=UPI0013575529|nr:DNA mismatch repair endonuclease MutL [Halorubrum sp. JWXQ-INN 858]MWV63785.1 DNA mismatch repair protein MutL [Halorubrum sp. JWXQ-INN 858]